MAAAALPILWSFRRCPYAMRARLAIAASGQRVELREIALRDKPDAFLAASPSGTVPCLTTQSIAHDESYDIMIWALTQSDPLGWRDMPPAGVGLITRCDGAFKTALDLYKYAARHPESDPIAARDTAATFLWELNNALQDTSHLFGDRATLADMAILPFVRQFAHVDLDWFTAQSWGALITWLEAFKTSTQFRAIMRKYPTWQAGDPPTVFPDPALSVFQ